MQFAHAELSLGHTSVPAALASAAAPITHGCQSCSATTSYRHWLLMAKAEVVRVKAAYDASFFSTA